MSRSSVVLQTLYGETGITSSFSEAGWMLCSQIPYLLQLPRRLLDALRMEFPVLSADFMVLLDVLMEQQMLKATFHGL